MSERAVTVLLWVLVVVLVAVVYVALDGSDHGFRRTTSIEDSFTRWKSPGGEFNPQAITTLREWMEKVRKPGIAGARNRIRGSAYWSASQ